MAVAAAFVFGAALPDPVSAQLNLSPGGVRMEEERDVPAAPVDVAHTPAKDAGKGGEFVIAPLPAYNPLLGWQVTVPAMYLYRPSGSDPDDEVWVTGAFGMYAQNESAAAGLFHKMSTGGDAWRFVGAGGYAHINFDYYGIGREGGGPSVPLSQPTTLFLGEGLRRVAPGLYAGLRAVYAETEVEPDFPSGLDIPPIIDSADLGLDFTIVTLAPRLQYDTRDSQFYPTDGWLADVNAAFAREAYRADSDYEKYDLSANYYLPVRDSGVLASRGIVKYAGDGAPFFIYPAFGQRSDLRGYETGTYRDRFLFAVQSEYRYRFAERFGAVAFAGIGTVSDSFGSWDRTLPSAGAGLRYVIARQNNINLRFDVAVGRDETVYYFGIGEAF